MRAPCQRRSDAWTVEEESSRGELPVRKTEVLGDDVVFGRQTRYAPSPLPRFSTCLPSEDTYARHP
jgi:hypothetical protein